MTSPNRPHLGFPDDLLQAKHLRDVPLSFSTIQIGDSNAHAGGSGGAEGSVGVIADIVKDTIIHKVGHGDIGSNETGSLGEDPTEENCAASIDQRRDSNEWRVSNFMPMGIFVLKPIRVKKIFDCNGYPTPDLREVSLEDAIAPFPNDRIWSVNPSTFLQYDRTRREWKSVLYDDIVAL